MNRVIVTLFLLFCSAKGYAGSDNEYPPEVLRLGVQKQFDEAKWILYCIHSDEELNFVRNTRNQKLTFGELPLKFDFLQVKGDTVELNFVFLYNGQPLRLGVIKNSVYWGAVYKLSTGEILKYSSQSTARYITPKFKDPKFKTFREVNPLQPEVIQYIKKNKGKLDPWSRKEAIKRGVINE